MRPFDMPLLAIDIETTGTDVWTDRVVQLGLVYSPAPDAEDVTIEVIVDPGVEISEEVSAIHGVTTERARAEGMSTRDMLTLLELQLERPRDMLNLMELQLERPEPFGIVAFNAPFDLTLLREEGRRHGLEVIRDEIGPVFDPMVLDKQLDPYRRGSRRLVDTARHYGIDLQNAHTAAADAAAALRIFRAMGNTPDSDTVTAHDLHTGQIQWQAQQQESLNGYWIRTGKHDRVREPGWPFAAKPEAGR